MLKLELQLKCPYKMSRTQESRSKHMTLDHETKARNLELELELKDEQRVLCHNGKG